jgi:chromosome segregation ATPase
MEESRAKASGEVVEPSPGPSPIGWLIRFLLRLAIVVALGVILGAGVYVGVPALVRALMEPVVQNTADIEILEEELLALRDREEREQEQLRDQLNRLGAELTVSREQVASQQATLEDLNERAQQLESSQDDLDLLSGKMDTIESQLAELEGDLRQLEETDPEAEIAATTLLEKFAILRTMELVSRARLELLRDNPGLARENLEAAIESLQVLSEPGTGLEGDRLDSAVERLRLAEEALSENPAVANEDLDGAWRLLVELSAMHARDPQRDS